MNRIIFLGPPGAGKGTQAQIICQHFGIPQISTGDLLRHEIKTQSTLGKELERIVNSGALVPDKLILEIICDRIRQGDCSEGYLMDGFPRTVGQAQACIDQGIGIDFVLVLSLADDDVVERLSGRRVHLASGRTYHVKFQPPKSPGLDDLTGDELVQRPDDQPDTIRKRLQVYHDQTSALISFYKSIAGIEFAEIDAANSIEAVSEQLFRCLEIDAGAAAAGRG